MKRGDVYWCNLGTPVGSEQAFTRPVLIVQNDTGNYHAPITIVVPMTTRAKNHLPTHVRVEVKDYLISYPDIYAGILMCEQVRVVDKSRITSFIGTLDSRTMQNIDTCLKVSLGITT